MTPAVPVQPLLPLLQSQMTATQWGVLGFGALLLLYMFVRPKLARKRKDPLEDRPFHLSLTQQRATEREMSHLLVELSEMARQVTAQLDTRAAKLELLIKEADEKLDRLQQLTRAPTALPPAPPPDGSPVGVTSDSTDPRHATVYTLFDQGRSVPEIAHELHRPDGEIELILALRTRR